MKNTISSFSTQDKIAVEISNDLDIWRSFIDYWNFNDWWPEIMLDNPKDKIEWKNVTYLWDISTQDKFFSNISAFQAITWYYAEKINIILPYFPVWTMERVDKEWQVATAMVMARLFDSTPSANWWKAVFHFFDIHDLHERFYHNDNVAFKLHTTMSLIKERIKWMENIAIAFPDAWAKKRFKKDFELYDLIECSKERDWDKRIIRITEWDSKGKNVIIVDDLIQSGTTLINCGAKLREWWAKSVSCYVPHAVCPNNSHIKIAENFDTFYTTNSIPDRKEKFADVSNIEVFDMIDLYKELIEREIGFLK